MNDSIPETQLDGLLRQRSTARLHLLPAKSAPIVCVIRRKPSKLFHIISWNTRTNQLIHGSWFRGKLFPFRCDVSFDGRFMVYLAMGSDGSTWNGLCSLPWLRSIEDAPNMGTWHGGGYWSDKDTLHVNDWMFPDKVPKRLGSGKGYRVVAERSPHGEDEGILYPRMERDGWERLGPPGREERLRGVARYTILCVDDPGWRWKWSSEHPELRCCYLGYLRHGRTFEFTIPKYPNLLGPDVEWATWDALGQLVVARCGCIELYGLDDLQAGYPRFRESLEHLRPPRGTTDAFPQP